MNSISNITVETWEKEVLAAEEPVLVDFFIPSCPSFSLREDLMNRMAEECGDSVKMGKVDVSRSMDLAITVRIQDLPTLVLFKKGRSLKHFTGPERLREMQTWWLNQRMDGFGTQVL